MQLIRESGEVNVDSTDIGVSDHFFLWLELGRVAKCCRKQKCIRIGMVPSIIDV